MSLKIVPVPDKFRFQDAFPYPLDNILDFELWLSQNIKEADVPEGWTYLPITWTAYYKYFQYGHDRRALGELQSFLDSLDKSKKYFTIVQYDNGILNDVRDLNISVFSMSGKPMDYPLPLISQPHKFEFPYSVRKRFISLVGAMTHPIRQEIMNSDLVAKNNCLIRSHKVDLYTYCEILHNSVFSLCPRGYGGNSFRIQESLEYGAIPVVISDDFHEPHYEAFEQYGVVIAPEDVKNIHTILSAIKPQTISWLQKTGKIAYEEYYTFESNRKLILKNLENSN